MKLEDIDLASICVLVNGVWLDDNYDDRWACTLDMDQPSKGPSTMQIASNSRGV